MLVYTADRFLAVGQLEHRLDMLLLLVLLINDQLMQSTRWSPQQDIPATEAYEVDVWFPGGVQEAGVSAIRWCCTEKAERVHGSKDQP